MNVFNLDALIGDTQFDRRACKGTTKKNKTKQQKRACKGLLQFLTSEIIIKSIYIFYK